MSIFFFNDTATTEIYTLSLHDALPILPVPPADRTEARQVAAADQVVEQLVAHDDAPRRAGLDVIGREGRDRKSTRLNSSHANISYAVFCLKKKKYTFRRHIRLSSTQRH